MNPISDESRFAVRSRSNLEGCRIELDPDRLCGTREAGRAALIVSDRSRPRTGAVRPLEVWGMFSPRILRALLQSPTGRYLKFVQIVHLIYTRRRLAKQEINRSNRSIPIGDRPKMK
jgi:hypothetical protein